MNYKDFLNMRTYFKSDWYDKPYPHDASAYPKYKQYDGITGANLLCYWQGIDKFCERLAAKEPIAISLEKAKLIPAYLYSWKWAFALGAYSLNGRTTEYGNLPSFYLMDMRDSTCVFGTSEENVSRVEDEDNFIKYHHFFLWSLQGHSFMGERFVSQRDFPGFPDWFWYEQRHLFPYYAEFSRYIHHKRGLYVPHGFGGRTYFLNWAQVGHLIKRHSLTGGDEAVARKVRIQ